MEELIRLIDELKRAAHLEGYIDGEDMASAGQRSPYEMNVQQAKRDLLNYIEDNYISKH